MSQARVVWLSGSLHERKNILSKLKIQFAGSEIQRYGDDVSYAYLEQQILTTSCFADKRLVIVSEMPQFSGTKPSMLNSFKKLLDSVPEDCVVVFDGVDEKSLENHVKKIGKVFSSEVSVERRDAAGWVVARFKEREKTISEADAEMVVESCGYDSSVKGIGTDQLRMAVRKISTYVGRKKSVTADDVIVNSFGVEEFVVWRILNVMDEKNIDLCRSIFHQFIDNEATPKAACEKMLSMASNRFRLLVFLKEGLAKKIAKTELASQALALKKFGKEEGQAYSEGTVRAALEGFYGRKPAVDLYTRKELVRILSCLQDCSAEARFLQDIPSLLLVADVAFLAICGHMDDTTMSLLRNTDESRI